MPLGSVPCRSAGSGGRSVAATGQGEAGGATISAAQTPRFSRVKSRASVAKARSIADRKRCGRRAGKREENERRVFARQGTAAGAAIFHTSLQGDVRPRAPRGAQLM